MSKLRTGTLSVAFETKNFQGFCRLPAEQFEVELQDGTAVLRMKLRSTRENEKVDEAQMHTDGFTGVTLRDALVLKKLKTFVAQNRGNVQGWRLRVQSRDVVFEHACTLSSEEDNTLSVRVVEGPALPRRAY